MKNNNHVYQRMFSRDLESLEHEQEMKQLRYYLKLWLILGGGASLLLSLVWYLAERLTG